MNLLTKQSTYILVIGLVFLSALFSCEDPSTIGIDLIDDNDDLGVFFTEIPLATKVVKLDSLNTKERGIMMTGDYTDSDFGNLKVQSYLRILPPTSSPNIPDTVLVADSIRMDFRYNYFFGEFPSSHRLFVHELTEQLDPDTSYYNFSSTPFNPVGVVDTTFMVSETDTLLSIDLEMMKDELFAAMKNYVADSTGSAEFLEQFNGLTLISDPGSSAVLGFDNAHSQSNITIYYTTNDTVVNTVDIRYSTYYNQITPDYMGTELDGIQLLTDFAPVSGRTYLQVGVGLVPKVDFQAYFDFVDNDTTGTIVINKAELKMDNLQGLSGAIEPPQEMSFYYTNDNNQIVIVGEQISLPATIQTDQIYNAAIRNNLDPNIANARSVRALLDTTNVAFRPEITLFLQLIADGALDRSSVDQVFSIPYSFVELPNSIFDNGRNVDRFFVEPGDLKLEIFYTRLK
jgi:hypothetical protein